MVDRRATAIAGGMVVLKGLARRHNVASPPELPQRAGRPQEDAPAPADPATPSGQQQVEFAVVDVEATRTECLEQRDEPSSTIAGRRSSRLLRARSATS